MIKVFIGHDPVEVGTYHVLANSIQRHSSMPVSITPVSLKNLEGIITRERHPMQSNEFAFSRFLVPYMTNYEGWAIFMDCDMLVTTDIAKLWAHRDDKFAVKVVHHTHIPEETVKYLGNKQTQYSRKNWSSVMLINCGHPKMRLLTPEFINTADGLFLHQFRFLEDEEIGYLPKQWNFLVGFDEKTPKPPSNIHYTTGGPYWPKYANCDYHSEWFREESLSRFIKKDE